MEPLSGLAWYMCHRHLHPGLFQVLGCCQELPCTGRERCSWWYEYLHTRCLSVFGARLTPFHSPEFTQSKPRCWVRGRGVGDSGYSSPLLAPSGSFCPHLLPPAPSPRLPFRATVSLSLCRSFIISSHGVQASLVI